MHRLKQFVSKFYDKIQNKNNFRLYIYPTDTDRFSIIFSNANFWIYIKWMQINQISGVQNTMKLLHLK